MNTSSRPPAPFNPWLTRFIQPGLILAGALLVLVVAWALNWPGAVTGIDINQHRLSLPAPVPHGTEMVVQTFRPTHDGLSALELLLVQGDGQAPGAGQLTLQLHDGAGALVTQRTLFSPNFEHNQPYTLTFPPQFESAGQVYQLTLSGDADNTLTVWAYELDAHSGGELNPAAQAAGALDLRFSTRYELTPVLALRRLAQLWGTAIPVFSLTLLLLWLPGRFGLRQLRQGAVWDPAARAGVALALGAAFWALVWLWGSLIGWRWSGWTLAGFLAVLALAEGVDLWRRRVWRHFNAASVRTQLKTSGPLLLILLIGLSVRLLAVRDDPFPLWVDASRHALITAVMTLTGRTVDSYAPLLAVERPFYHYGFHALPAGLQLLTQWPLARTLLYLGQLLNGLAPLAVYSGLWLATRRRGASLLAAFLVALPFFFPAYYSTWGRLTQLLGMLLLPPLLGLTWRLQLVRRPPGRAPLLLALLAAGLFLVHARVFLFYGPFVLVVWLLGRGRGGRRLMAAAALGGLLISPRLLTLLRLLGDPASFRADSGSYNQFPFNYITVGWEQPFLWLALPAALLVLVAAERRRRWARWPLALLLWVGLLFLLLTGGPLALPASWLVNVGSMYITLYVPLAWLLALAAAQLSRWLARQPLFRLVLPPLLGALLTLLFLFGLRQQMTILNPATRLAEPADAAGLAWVAANVPPDALIANSAWNWLGGAWAGSDGGAWLLPLTGRQTTTPPVDYTFDAGFISRVAAFNEAAEAVTDWSDPAAAAWLRAQNVTHVYVGARGGYLRPDQLARNPEMTLLWRQDGVFVFELHRPATTS